MYFTVKKYNTSNANRCNPNNKIIFIILTFKNTPNFNLILPYFQTFLKEN